MPQPRLFTPIALRAVTARNRIAISPMCQYSATDGFADDWHLVHLGKFAQGGAGIVFVEATAVEARGRITHGDTGIWSEAHVKPLARIAAFLAANGAVPAIQLAHAGRKASMQRPWYGNGPLGAADVARGDKPWGVVAPSPIPLDPGWLVPAEITVEDMAEIRQHWREATLRALAAGFEIVEVHAAHGYLLHSFLSPITNKRADAYGGSREARMRFPLEVVETVRAAWPEEKPLFVRVSSVDGVEGGWELDDTVAFAKELKARGVDVVDCSSGGIGGSATASGSVPRGLGFQVPFAERVKREAGIPTMAVGLIIEPHHAESVLEAGQADIIAIGRQALEDPFWALHAASALGAFGYEDAAWPKQYGWWLERRRRVVEKMRAAGALK
jgi:2,4-dienoyl-CoA reductase-like NADH-dependent reductase (Old Yellow Enzyme family)